MGLTGIADARARMNIAMYMHIIMDITVIIIAEVTFPSGVVLDLRFWPHHLLRFHLRHRLRRHHHHHRFSPLSSPCLRHRRRPISTVTEARSLCRLCQFCPLTLRIRHLRFLVCRPSDLCHRTTPGNGLHLPR
jgi:hypothetical protein